MPGTRKLGRATDHRMAMLRGLVTYLLENGRIETTVTRAKEVRSLAEKYITIAKVPSLANKRKAFAFITKEDVVKKLFEEIAPLYTDRTGGYTRIIRTGPRRGDAAEMCILELVVEEKAAPQAKSKAPAKPRATRNRKPAAETKEEAVAEETVETEEVVETVEEVAVVEEAPAEAAE